MNIAFYSNFINHHQVHVADELYRLSDGQYTFVQTRPMPDSFTKNGYPDYSSRPYVLKTYEGEDNYQKAIKMALDSDVVIHGSAPIVFLKERIKAHKLTFSYSERWFKLGLRAKASFFLHPNNRDKRRLFFSGREAPWYMLCASAYTPNDVNSIGLFEDKCYRWGYFTKAPALNIEDIVGASVPSAERTASTLKILWVARFLKLKHPERMLQLASHLRSHNVDFTIDMIGTGELYNTIKLQIEKDGLQDYVHLLGSMPNEEVLKQMRTHEIFCFTSDQNEGWGAVLNEAMSNGCCPIVAKEIGSAPFLINDGVNGFLFKNAEVRSFCEKVDFLRTHPIILKQMRMNAFNTIHEIWSPDNAAKRLYDLAEGFLQNRFVNYEDGPCSIVFPYK